jgi:hypothetical protein
MPSSPKNPRARRAEEDNRRPWPASADDSHSDVFERPTLAPPFDLEEFAKSRMGQADERRSLPNTPTLEPPAPSGDTPEAPRSAVRERPELTLEELDEVGLLERLGSLARVPTLTVDPSEVRTLPVDHRGAFLLSQVDGVSTVEMILDVSGMSRLEALRILCAFSDQGIIRLD